MRRDIFSPPVHTISTSNKTRISVHDDLQLGATITRPQTSEPCPALLWYDPYRQAMHGETDEMARYFGERGYIFVRLHVRGTGNSDGYSTDEYTVPETADGVAAINWLATQPWCSGQVGMLGSSYSGFNTLQVAAMAPAPLKAIAPAYFTDRRFTDDCHYKGGNLRGYYDMLTYGLSMVANNGLPPVPEAIGAGWSDLWQERLEKSEPYLLKWVRQQVENEYWAVGSIAGHYHQIKAATFLIAGSNDGYLNPPFRVFDQLQVPKKLLFGPWSHTYPHKSHCGPRIDVFFELLRWWDPWLKGMDNGVLDEPAVQIYEREHEPPITDRTQIKGRWRMAAGLPAGPPQTFHLHPDQLSSAPCQTPGSASVRYLPAASQHGGLWDAGVPYMLPGEQTFDCAHALNFISQPLTDDLAIFGMPTFELSVSSDVAVMPLAVRLLDVSPAGERVLVTRGILNLTRRGGMDRPEPLTPGEIVSARFHLEGCTWRFRAGHRLQLSINGSDFPNVWPTPLAGNLTLYWGPDYPAQITLPVWDSGDEPAFAYPPSTAEVRPTNSGARPWRIIHDVLEDQYRLQIERVDSQGEMGVSHRDPAKAWVKSTQLAREHWAGADVVSTATGLMSSDASHFHINLALNVTLNGGLYFQKQWSESIPRHLL